MSKLTASKVTKFYWFYWSNGSAKKKNLCSNLADANVSPF